MITIVCVGAILFHFMRNADDLKKVLSLSWHQVTIIALLIFMYLFVFTGRSLAVVRKCSNRSISFFHWFGISVTGRFLSLFVPQMGNVYQGVRLKRIFEVSYTAYLSSKFSLAWIDFVFNLLFAAVVIIVADYSFFILGLPAPVILLIFAILIALMPPIVLYILRSLRIQARIVGWMMEKVQILLKITVENIMDAPYLLRIISMGIILFSITCGIIYICFDALGAHSSVGAIVLFCTLLKLSDHVSLTPGNLGIREVLFGLLSDFFGMGVSEGILVSIICRVIFQIEIMLIVAVVNIPMLFGSKEDFF